MNTTTQTLYCYYCIIIIIIIIIIFNILQVWHLLWSDDIFLLTEILFVFLCSWSSEKLQTHYTVQIIFTLLNLLL
jgi:hypothetical protein